MNSFFHELTIASCIGRGQEVCTAQRAERREAGLVPQRVPVLKARLAEVMATASYKVQGGKQKGRESVSSGPQLSRRTGC